MDLLYENDHKFGVMEDTCMGDILDDDVFQSPSSTSSDSYMDNDWLHSFFEDPVLNDKMITDAVPAPRIQSEHSYSINNEVPASPLGLSKLEDLDSTFFTNTTQALDLSNKQTLNTAGLTFPASTATSLSTTTLPVKQEPLELMDNILATCTSATTTSASKQPTIILATTSMPTSSAADDKVTTHQIIAHTTQAVTTPMFTIKTEPEDLLDNNMEQTINMDSLIMPPTPPSSASSDSEGSQSPQRSAPSSPVRQLPLSKHSSPSSHYSSSSKPYSQPVFTNPVSLLSNSYLADIPQSGVLMLTEEEKRTLVSEGYPIPAKLPLTKQEEKNLKKIRRKIKNKISAQESRRKKKEYLETLEKRVEAFSQENTDLKKKLDSLETNNRTLLGQLQKLQSLVSKVTRPSNGTTQTGTVLMVLVLCFAVFLGGWSPSSLNLGYSSGSSLQNPVFFGNPYMVQPAPKMGPCKQGAKVDAYSTPNMKSRVLLSMQDDQTHYEPYAPYVGHDADTEGTEKVDHDNSVLNPDVLAVTSNDNSKVVEMEVVSVAERVLQSNKTGKVKVSKDQNLLHPDIEATASFIKSHADGTVETA